MSRIRLKFMPGVSTSTRKWCEYLAHYYEQHSKVRHVITVIVTRHEHVADDVLGKCRDTVGTIEFRSGRPLVMVAGGQGKREVGVTLFHELIHYDCWRNRKRHDEDEIDRRAEKMLKEATG